MIYQVTGTSPTLVIIVSVRYPRPVTKLVQLLGLVIAVIMVTIKNLNWLA